MGPHEPQTPPPGPRGAPEFFGELPPPARLAKKFRGAPGARGGWGGPWGPMGPKFTLFYIKIVIFNILSLYFIIKRLDHQHFGQAGGRSQHVAFAFFIYLNLASIFI